MLVAISVALFSFSAAAADTLVIDHVTLIDGTGSPARANMTVVVDEGRFRTVAPTSELGPIAGRRIDGHGKFLIPGLVDMHIHLRGSTESTAEGIAALHSYLYCGVTSVYDAGNVPEFIFALRARERSGSLQGPRIFATGGIVTAPGSHGSGAGATEIESWPQARTALDAHLALEPDVMKFALEERGWGARPLIPLLDVGLMQRAIEYANDYACAPFFGRCQTV